MEVVATWPACQACPPPTSGTGSTAPRLLSPPHPRGLPSLIWSEKGRRESETRTETESESENSGNENWRGRESITTKTAATETERERKNCITEIERRRESGRER